MKTCDVEFSLAGVSFRRENFQQAALVPGDLLTLKREPENKFDPNAIAVYKGALHIGYVPSEWTRLLGSGTMECRVGTVRAHGAVLIASAVV